MLAITAPFPNPGSLALLRGAQVRIHQVNCDGTFLTFGERGSYTATREELAAIDLAASAVEQWAAARVDRVDLSGRTLIGVAMDDYRDWCIGNGHQPVNAGHHAKFCRMVRDIGLRTTTRSIKRHFGGYVRQLCLSAALHPLPGDRS